jgi:hypothetical protein
MRRIALHYEHCGCGAKEVPLLPDAVLKWLTRYTQKRIFAADRYRPFIGSQARVDASRFLLSVVALLMVRDGRYRIRFRIQGSSEA